MNNGIAGRFGTIGHSGHDLPASHIEIIWEDGRCRRRDIPRGKVYFGFCACCTPGAFHVLPGGESARSKLPDCVVEFDVEGVIPHNGTAFCMAIVGGAEKAAGRKFEVQSWWMTKTRKTFRAVVA